MRLSELKPALNAIAEMTRWFIVKPQQNKAVPQPVFLTLRRRG
jgi:hypothetical protein